MGDREIDQAALADMITLQRKEIERLRSVNAELVAALEALLTPNGPVDADDVERWMRDSAEQMGKAEHTLKLAKEPD